MAQIPSSFARRTFRIRAFDVAAGLIAPLLAMLIRDPSMLTRDDLAGSLVYPLIAVVATAFMASYFRIAQILSRYLSTEDILALVKCAAAATLVTTAVAFSVMRLDMVPRSLPALHLIILTTLLIGARALMSEHYRRQDSVSMVARTTLRENVLLVGATRMAWLYMRMLSCVRDPHQRIIALLDDDKNLQGRAIAGHPVIGRPADLASVLAEYASHGVTIDRVLVTHPDPADEAAAEAILADICAERGVELEFLARRLDFFPMSASADEAPEDAEDAEDDVAPVTDAANYWRFRRVVDIAVSAVAIVALSPFFALVALVVIYDVGVPAVFWQERVGRNGKRIYIHKFRSLRGPVDKSGALLTDEERLSPIGRFLRATRLDELPQLFDVLRGDMTLIGPRPLLPIDLPKDPSVRLQVRPGVTGWAQVRGGKLVSAEEKNALDEWYICHVSPRLDLRILWLTLLMPWRGDRRAEGAVARAIRFRKQRLREQAQPANASSNSAPVDTQAA